MKRHLSAILLAGTALAASSAAYAAPVFMLQFGSFESREEAETKLTALKSKHAGVLSRMEAGIREVTLPPDNLTVYRTQAGPLATRADAQSVCSQLASNGDECYVVETAMVPALSPVATAKVEPTKTEPKTEETATELKTTEAAPLPKADLPTASTETVAPAIKPVKLAEVAPAPKAETPVMKASAPAPEKTLVPVPTTDAKIASVTVPANVRDPQNMAMLKSVAPAPMPAPVVHEQQLEAAAELDKALEEAAAKPSKAPSALTQPSPFAASSIGVSPATTSTRIADDKLASGQEVTAKKKETSFWDRLNPFSEAEPAEPAASSMPAPELATAAPVEEVTASLAAPLPEATTLSSPAVAEPVPVKASAPVAPMAPLPISAPVETVEPVVQPVAQVPTPAPQVVMESADVPKPVAAPVAATPMPAPLSAPAPLAAAPATLAPAPVEPAPVITQAEPFPLPPPPAPLKAQMPVAAPLAAMPIAPVTAAPAPVIAPAPLAAAPQPTGAVPPVPVTGANAATNETVRVEEAKRVPLTEAAPAPLPTPTPAPPVMSLPATTVAPALPMALSPSATLGQKTLWAQIGLFNDAQSALAFWDGYRRAHPDFPVVRVRVTSPLMAQERGYASVTLRVGPFAREAFIQNLCTTLAENEATEELKCGSIVDMGIAANPYGTRDGLLPQSRYTR